LSALEQNFNEELNKKIDASDVYTTTQVDKKISEKITEVIGTAPEKLDTLEEIAAKLENNDDVVTALTNSIAEKTNTTDFNEFVNEVNTNNENTAGVLVQLQENIDNIQLTPGPPGDDGKSAYEIYISRIPQGEPIPSEEEWL